MKTLPCSPNEPTRGMVWFPRMLDKIRLHANGALPKDYIPFLGKGFDGRCVRYLRVEYADLVARVLEGGSNEEVLDWCFQKGRELSEEDIQIWSDFLRKRGWRDSVEVLADLETSKKESGLGDRTDLDTYFRFNDADEGREVDGCLTRGHVFGNPASIFRVTDLTASQDYYVNVLGFSVNWMEKGIVSVSRGECTIFLCEYDQSQAGMWIWIGVADCEALHQELLKKGAQVRHPPTNFPWAFEMQVEDLDGNVLRLGSSPKENSPYGCFLDANKKAWEIS